RSACSRTLSDGCGFSAFSWVFLKNELVRGGPPGQGRAGMTGDLLDNAGNHAGADGTAAFTDGEAQAFFHGDRRNQLHGNGDVVAGQDHFLVLGQLDAAGDIGGTEVELRTIALEIGRSSCRVRV